MAHEYRATVKWTRGDAKFTDQRYSRGHTWRFDGGITVPASSSPLSVRLPYSVAEAVDPEEALVAALSSCHMLTFLYVAAKQGFVVDAYADEAVGEMTKNERGKLWVSKVTLAPADHLRGRQAPDAAATRRAAPPRPRGVLHRQLGEERGGGARRDVVCVSSRQEHGRRMRYLPLTPDDRAEMLARIGVADIDALFADIPADKRLKALPTCRCTKSEIEVERTLARHGGEERRGRLGAVLRRLRRLQAPRAGERRSPDPALGVPHLLHALPAGDRAGHAAVSVRVPDPGGAC